MGEQKKYVCGFRFDERLQKILLIEKKKPEWQRGFINGIGGKVDGDESYRDAIEREFEEETKLGTFDDWTEFAILQSDAFKVVFFVSTGNDIFDYQGHDQDIGEGIIRLYDYPDVLVEKPVLYNLKWLVPLSLDAEIKFPITFDVD